MEQNNKIEELILEYQKELDVAIAIGNEDKIRTIKHCINIAKIKNLPSTDVKVDGELSVTKNVIQDNISQINDILSTLRKPMGNDFTNSMKFLSEAKTLEKLSELTNLATTKEQLDIIFLMVGDITSTVNYKMKKDYI